MTDPAATFIVDCPICKAKVAALEAGCVQNTWMLEYAVEPVGLKLFVGQCPRCSTLLAAKSRQLRFKGWEDDDEDVWADPVRVYPSPSKTFSSFKIPKSVTDSLAEGDIALQGNAKIAACAMFGRALEALCRDVLYTDEEKEAVLGWNQKKEIKELARFV